MSWLSNLECHFLLEKENTTNNLLWGVGYHGLVVVNDDNTNCNLFPNKSQSGRNTSVDGW